MAEGRTGNRQIADLLERIALLLETKGESPFRVRSYRTAANSIREASQPIAKLAHAGGADRLTEIRGIGERLASLIAEYLDTGECELLKTLEGEVPPEKVRAPVSHSVGRPVALPVGLILEIDEEYRGKAAANTLKKIAPRRLNPDREAWLPILTTEKEGYQFTVMFSNTERAHELGKTDDWVVVYAQKGKGESQCTIVTESRGALKGKRVIRGREKECAVHYLGQ